MWTVKAISPLEGRRIEELVRAHQRSVRGFLAFLGCPAALVDDLVQDVFLSVLSSGFEDRGPRPTAAYLRRVAHHLLLKALRRERRSGALPEAAAAEAAWVEYERDDGGEGYLAALRECLRRMKGRPREVLALRYESSLRRGAIAERLGMAESGVKSVLARARRSLRACVEERLESS